MIDSILINFNEDITIQECFMEACALATAKNTRVDFEFWRGSDRKMAIWVSPGETPEYCMKLFCRNAPWNRKLASEDLA